MFTFAISSPDEFSPFIALALRNRLVYRHSDFKRFIFDDLATLCKFCKLWSSNSGVQDCLGKDVRPVVSLFKINFSSKSTQDDRFSPSFTVWSVFDRKFLIWPSFSDRWRDVGMGTNFAVNTGKSANRQWANRRLGVEYRNCDFKRFICNDRATSCEHLANFGPVNPKFFEKGERRTPLVDQQFGYVRLTAPLLDLAGISTEFSGAITTQFCFTYSLEGVSAMPRGVYDSHCHAFLVPFLSLLSPSPPLRNRPLKSS